MTVSDRQFLNAVYRDADGNPPDPPLSILQILNKIFDANNNALKIAGVSGGGGLLKTGATVSYHTGDDGDLEKGIAKSFTVLSTGEYSGTTNITINGKTYAMSNNCVDDNNTGLMWARYVPTSDIGPGSNGQLFWDAWSLDNKTTIFFDNASGEIRDSASGFDTGALCVGRIFTVAGSAFNDRTYTVSSILADAITTVEGVIDEAAGATITLATVADLIWDFVDQANLHELAGYNDWRIPNFFELASIVDLGKYNPVIDIIFFPSTPSDYHWVSSTRPGDSSRAFLVHFYNGRVYYYVKAQSRYYGRLVRG